MEEQNKIQWLLTWQSIIGLAASTLSLDEINASRIVSFKVTDVEVDLSGQVNLNIRVHLIDGLQKPDQYYTMFVDVGTASDMKALTAEMYFFYN